jgi:hypothetical protein
MISIKKLFTTWLILIFLTIVSVLLGNEFTLYIKHNALFVLVVMFIVTLKGQQIIDMFMELSLAPQKWRLLLLSYVVIIPSVISVIYLW